MEENNQNNVNINAEDLKKEAKETVNQVKDTFKNIDMKQETENTKKYLSRFIKEPITVIGEIAHDNTNTFLKVSVFILVIIVAASFLEELFSTASTLFSLGFAYFFKTFFSRTINVIKSIINPVLMVAVITAIIYFMNSKSKKSFVTTFTTVMAAFIPKAAAYVLSILTVVINGAYRITSPINGLLGLLTTVFTFFAVKELLDEPENDSAIKKFLIIEAIYYVARFVLSFLSISI